MEIKVKLLPHAHGLPLPAYQTSGAAGFDLLAAVPSDAPICLAPGRRCLAPTGVVVEIPYGFEGQVRPRSGIAVKHGVTVLNAPGTVDSDFRGEVGVILINHGDDAFEIARGDRIAQFVIAPVTQAKLKMVEDTNETGRGAGGFGSTGRS